MGKAIVIVQLNTQSVSQGIYILKVENGDDIMISKILKN
jgi:hypothetical protein